MWTIDFECVLFVGAIHLVDLVEVMSVRWFSWVGFAKLKLVGYIHVYMAEYHSLIIDNYWRPFTNYQLSEVLPKLTNVCVCIYIYSI
jgi:hypothetical protein